MVLSILIEHEASTNFFSNNNYGAKSVKWNIPLNICMRRHVILNFHTNLISELQFFTIPIPTLIPLGLIPIGFRFQDLPKSMIPIPVDSDSDFDSDSSVSQKKLIPIPFPIPTNQALIQILIPESDSDSGIFYSSDRLAA